MFSKHVFRCPSRQLISSLSRSTTLQNERISAISSNLVKQNFSCFKNIQKASNQPVRNPTCEMVSDPERVSFTQRTHLCGGIGIADVGKEVTLCGWVQYYRFKALFIVIRDFSGIIQIVLSDETTYDFDVDSLSLESVVLVQGVVVRRPEGQENLKMKTGQVEVAARTFSLLNPCSKGLPIDISDHKTSNDLMRMKYRYLDIRSKYIQKNLRTRSQMMMKMREFLCNQHGFVDVETPTLFRRTPGGAKEFVVPTQHKGKFYTLPQSPQQFKQLLMVGGIDRYFQIARCYRDESTRADRQPEFTQVDIEMSFTTAQEIQDLIEQLLQYSWHEGEITLPFPRMTYKDAMENYGTDKPDTRYDMKLFNLNEAFASSGIKSFETTLHSDTGQVIGMRIPRGSNYLSNREITEIVQNDNILKDCELSALRINDKNEWKCPYQKYLTEETKQKITSALNIEPGDVIFISNGEHYNPHTCLGKARTIVASILQSKGVQIKNEDQFNFLWVTDFPLFLPKDEGEGLESAHHPFTAPLPEDEHLIQTHPEQVRSQHYDLVLNGYEIGGGSIRIHNEQLQRYVLTEVLKENTDDLEHLLEALSYGCPPHGGIALGLDRLLAVICKAPSIKDVIAFPKGRDGQDIMSNAPAPLSESDLNDYHIQIKH